MIVFKVTSEGVEQLDLKSNSFEELKAAILKSEIPRKEEETHVNNQDTTNSSNAVSEKYEQFNKLNSLISQAIADRAEVLNMSMQLIENTNKIIGEMKDSKFKNEFYNIVMKEYKECLSMSNKTLNVITKTINDAFEEKIKLILND